MKMPITSLLLLAACGLLSGCSSRSVMPNKDGVEVSREAPDKDDKCRKIGRITGTSGSAKGTREEVLEDLKQTAANKGANFVVVKQYSPQGTSVTGVAYVCP